MKENQKKRRKKRLAADDKQNIFMKRYCFRLSKNKTIKTLTKAAEMLGTNTGNLRRALLDQSKGEKAVKLKEEALKLAGMTSRNKQSIATTVIVAPLPATDLQQ